MLCCRVLPGAAGCCQTCCQAVRTCVDFQVLPGCRVAVAGLPGLLPGHAAGLLPGLCSGCQVADTGLWLCSKHSTSGRLIIGRQEEVLD